MPIVPAVSDSTLPIPRQAPGRTPRPAPRPVPRAVVAPVRRRPVEAPSLARRRWGFVAAAVLMLATLPLHLLGLALVALEVLSPSIDGTAPLFYAAVGLAQLLLLTLVATVGQLIGGGTDRWRRRMAFACVNGLLVVLAAAVGWVLLLR